MQAVLSSGSSQSCPSLPLLGGRGMSWKTNCRHPTVLPRPTSAEFFSAIAPNLNVRAALGLRFVFSPPPPLFLPTWAIFCDESLRTEVAGVCVRQHQRSALLWFWSNGGSRLRQCGPNADSSLNGPSLREPSCSSDRRAVPAQQTSRNEQQTWAAERSSSRAGSESHRRRRNFGDMWVFETFAEFFFFLFWLIDVKEPGFPLCPCFVGHVRLQLRQAGNKCAPSPASAMEAVYSA